MKEMFISILSDALHEKKTDQLFDKLELESMLDEAVKHGVAGSFIQALPKQDSSCVKLLEAKLHSVDMLQEYEGNLILREMTNQGVPCIPLKGWILRNIYPHPHMRTMGDLDLLISPKYLTEAQNIMTRLGYTIEKEQFTDYHVCYYKAPCLIVEIHIRLAEETNCPVLDSVWERAVTQANDYPKLCNEDSYIFLIYHAAKHVILGGIGLRYIMDLWIMLKHFSQRSNSVTPIQSEKILEGLERLGLTSFAAYSEQLVNEWFGSPGTYITRMTWDAEAMNLWHEYVLSSGAFGGVISSYENQLTKDSRFTIVFRKVFPSRKQLRIYYPELIEKPWLMPKVWTVRLWRKLKGGDALTGINSLNHVSSKGREQRKYLLKHLGLNGKL